VNLIIKGFTLVRNNGKILTFLSLLFLGNECYSQLSIDSLVKQFSNINRSMFKNGKDSLPFSALSTKIKGGLSQSSSTGFLDKPLVYGFGRNKKGAGKPWVHVGTGYVSYNLSYRSNIDTPFREQQVVQHFINTGFSLQVGGMPLRVSGLIRRSNSAFFNNINDIQVVFDAGRVRQMVGGYLRGRLQQYADHLYDSVLGLQYLHGKQALNRMEGALKAPNLLQQLAAYQELLDIPSLSYLPGLSDSANLSRADSVKRVATAFFASYRLLDSTMGKLRRQVDSLALLYGQMQTRYKQVMALANGRLDGLQDVQQWNGYLAKLGITAPLLPAKYRRLLALRQLGIGRNLVNYSELTGRNIGLKGVNIEYAAQTLYVAFAAGVVDYRYRDFSVNRANRTIPYMVLLRLGKGRPDGTHLYMSVFTGRKQAWGPSGVIDAGRVSSPVTGLSLEAQYSFNANNRITAEVAGSAAPDFRVVPVAKAQFNLSDRKTHAYSLRVYHYLPHSNTKITGFYKYTGAHFQSFANFQTTTALESWHLQVNQYFFKSRLRIHLAVRNNDFSNPYFIQPYHSKALFKSAQLTFRARRWPSISVGYAPVSQLTRLDNQLMENQFNSLNASVNHSYKMGDRRAHTSVLYNRFYNTHVDTGFAYYNAANLFVNQTVVFERFTMQVSVSRSKNSNYELQVLDGGLAFKAGKRGNIGFGWRVNNFNQLETKTGYYGSVQLNLRRWGQLSAVYDNGFLPTTNRLFVRNEFCNLIFTKNFE
jgi:hypothetical protein